MTSLRAWVAVLAFASAVSTAGCDDDGGGGSGNADAFVGAWTFSSGTIEPACNNLTLAPVDLTGAPLTITKVDASHIRSMITSSSLSCDVTFSVNGSTATATSGGTCMVSVSGASATATVTSWTLTLSGTTGLTSSLMGMIKSLVTCAPTGSGSLTRAQ